jgi:hypothetical protein
VDILEKRKISYPWRITNPGSSSPSARNCTDYRILARKEHCLLQRQFVSAMEYLYWHSKHKPNESQKVREMAQIKFITKWQSVYKKCRILSYVMPSVYKTCTVLMVLILQTACTVKHLSLGNKCKRMAGRTKGFCLLQSVQTDSRIHLAFYSMNNAASFPGNKATVL